MNGTKDQVHDHHHAEMHGIDAEVDRRRHHDRDQDQHRRQHFHEAADQQQHNIASKQKHQRIFDRVDNHRGERLRHAADRKAPAQRTRCHHQHQHQTGSLDRLDQDARQHAPFKRAINHEAQEQRIHRGNRCRLGRREVTTEHAAEQDHRRHQRPYAVAECTPDGGEAGERLATEALPLGNDRHHHHQRQAHQHARHEAGQKQPANRHVG